MGWQIPSYIIFLILSGLISAALAIYAWRTVNHFKQTEQKLQQRNQELALYNWVGQTFSSTLVQNQPFGE